MTYRDYQIGFSGTDLISPIQFEYYPELKYRKPQALEHALYRLEEVQGVINDPELNGYESAQHKRFLRAEAEDDEVREAG